MKFRKNDGREQIKLFYYESTDVWTNSKALEKDFVLKHITFFKVGESSRLLSYASYWDICNGPYFYWV